MLDVEDVTSVDQNERQHSYELHWLPRMQQAGHSQQFMYTTALFTLPALHCNQSATSSWYTVNRNWQAVLHLFCCNSHIIVIYRLLFWLKWTRCNQHLSGKDKQVHTARNSFDSHSQCEVLNHFSCCSRLHHRSSGQIHYWPYVQI
jgi:hypothetical protein